MAAIFLLAIYAAASLALFVFGLNCYVLVVLYLRRRWAAAAFNARVIDADLLAAPGRGPCPRVTTQIPVYNEANVVERAIRAVAAMDYPRDCHEVQVLDDSTDLTCAIVDRVAAELRAAGHWITVFRRPVRTGFKAGALQAGLKTAAGEFIAIFDADFVPSRAFLRQTVPFLMLDTGLGLVQGRWGHLNPDDNLLTRTQAIGIDGHFMVEQSARTFNGLMMNFNGTAGIWRRQAIEDAGGWSADTLTEDLDLSYRAQLAGWRTHFVAEAVVPAELPGNIAAFKSQQFRWAKGSIQTAIKILPRILRSPVPRWTKIQATLHLTHYAIHPLMLLVALSAWPVMAHFPADLPAFWRPFVVVALAVVVLAPNATYIVSQRALYRTWIRRLCWLPVLTGIGIGFTVNNTHAVLEALFGKTGEFVRTPKRGDQAKAVYRSRKSIVPWIEIAMGLYCFASLICYLASGRILIGSFLAVYSIGFTWVGVLSLLEQRASRALGQTTVTESIRGEVAA